MAKVTSQNLSEEISKMLDEWAEGEIKTVSEAIKGAAKLGVKALKNDSPRASGDYAKGWKAKTDEGRTSTSAVLYNANKPGLTHLLEHGHAKRGGGRVKAIVHIKPVEEELEKTLLKELEQKL